MFRGRCCGGGGSRRRRRRRRRRCFPFISSAPPTCTRTIVRCIAARSTEVHFFSPTSRDLRGGGRGGGGGGATLFVLPSFFLLFQPLFSSHNWIEEVDEGSPQSALLFIRGFDGREGRIAVYQRGRGPTGMIGHCKKSCIFDFWRIADICMFRCCQDRDFGWKAFWKTFLPLQSSD